MSRDVNFERMDELVKEGYLRKVYSEDKKLFLYNYTDACTYDKKWNKHTTNARGTVYESSTGQVVAKAFPKFWNFEELKSTQQRYILKQDNFTAYEKMDGSLGIIFHYDGKWYVNTRGSFSSDQAIAGLNVLNTKYSPDKLNKNYTYLNEIITPMNRIILDYKGREFLPCLAIMDLESGKELTRKEFEEESNRVGFEVPEIYEFNSIDEIVKWKQEIGADQEGTVLQYFQNGKPERVKFKSTAYLEIARILSNVNFLSLWANMVWGKVAEDFLEKIPEEFRDLVDTTTENLEEKFSQEYEKMNKEYLEFSKSIDINDSKAFALKMRESNYEYKTAFFELRKFSVVKESDILEYSKIVYENMDELRKNPDAESYSQISPNQLRMHIKKFTASLSGNNKVIHNIEKIIMDKIRPSGNVE